MKCCPESVKIFRNFDNSSTNSNITHKAVIHSHWFSRENCLTGSLHSRHIK